jgi:DNA-binding MarR family transcriptional regulator
MIDDKKKEQYATRVATAARVSNMCRMMTTNTSGLICGLLIEKGADTDPFSGIIDTNTIRDELSVNQPTASMALTSLVDHGLLIEVDRSASGVANPPKNLKFYKLSKSARLIFITLENLSDKLWLK